MRQKVQFAVIRELSELTALLPQIGKLADSNKDALGFWSPSALQEAVNRKRLIALIVDVDGLRQLAGYIHYSGVFPHAKVQQIAVVPDYRRTGAGSALIQTLVSDLEDLGYLTVKAEIADNLAAPLKFYPKNSFEFASSKPGGKSRNRSILVHVRELDNDDLFSLESRNRPSHFDLGIRRRSAGDAPFYAFDLNVYFDLVRDRAHSESARMLFGSALAHDIRLAVADEFVSELKRTSSNTTADPILQMALRLPRLPKSDAEQLTKLRDVIHDIVFVTPNLTSAGSVQALSDAGHLAHAALARASAFVTRDGAIIEARTELLNEIGIDVITLDELLPLLPHESITDSSLIQQGNGFECRKITRTELSDYLANVQIPQSLTTEFGQQAGSNFQTSIEGIAEAGRLVGVGVVQVPRGMEPVARMLVHVRPEHVESQLFADYLLETCTRQACADLPTMLELAHVPGQSATHSIAIAKGFVRDKIGNSYRKVALGRPLTLETWTAAASEIRRRSGLILPDQLPQTASEQVSVTSGDGKEASLPMRQLEDILSPTIFIWPGRDGVIVPIGHGYANELLGTNNQSAFSFLANRDAAFLSRRAYVNTPRAANIMRPDSPILFYESKRSGGRGAVLAIARIIDVVVAQKSDIPSDGKRRLVVDSVDGFSASDDVLLTTFDNLFVLPSPVSLKALKKIGATGSANLISAVPLSSDQITQILTLGWPRKNAK